MAKAESNHVHRLKRHRYKNGSAIFFCTTNDCHYKISVELSLGKKTACWRCESPFFLDEYSMRLVKPHCRNCHIPRIPRDRKQNPSVDYNLNESRSELDKTEPVEREPEFEEVELVGGEPELEEFLDEG